MTPGKMTEERLGEIEAARNDADLLGPWPSDMPEGEYKSRVLANQMYTLLVWNELPNLIAALREAWGVIDAADALLHYLHHWMHGQGRLGLKHCNEASAARFIAEFWPVTWDIGEPPSDEKILTLNDFKDRLRRGR